MLILDPSQTPVLIGVVGFVIWGLAKGLIHIIRLRERKAPKAERLSFYWLEFSYHGAVIFAVLEAMGLHWTAVSVAIRAAWWTT